MELVKLLTNKEKYFNYIDSLTDNSLKKMKNVSITGDSISKDLSFYRLSVSYYFINKYTVITFIKNAKTKEHMISEKSFSLTESNEGIFKVDSIFRNDTTSVAENQWDLFERKLDESYFHSITSKPYITGTDGSIWTLEFSKYSFYQKKRVHHAVSIWEPYENSSFRKACEYLLEIPKVSR